MSDVKEERQRPTSVPEQAWWSAEENEWVAGEVDEQEERQGTFRYWRPDGTLCCVNEYAEGVAHGPYERYHETGEVSQRGTLKQGRVDGLATYFFVASGPTTENSTMTNYGPNVARMEIEYEAGALRAFRLFDAHNRPLTRTGKPCPERPDGVPGRAEYHDDGRWILYHWDAEGKRDGQVFIYDEGGSLLAEHTYAKDVLHGPTSTYGAGQVLKERVEYAHGELTGELLAYHASGEVATRVTSPGGDESAPLLEAYDEAGAPIYSHQGISIAAGDEAAGLSEREERALAGEELSSSDVAPSDALWAHLIAIGWGGEANRDRDRSRRARRWVRGEAPAHVQEALARTGLALAPRILTSQRAARRAARRRSQRSQRSAAKGELTRALSSAGGAGAMLALDDATPEALEILRAHRHGSNLRLIHLGLTEVPRAAGALSGLESLDVSNNELTELPERLVEMPLLVKIDASHNRVARVDRALAHMPRLGSLMLSYNDMARIPEGVFGLRRLRSLSLGDNRLTAVPAAIGELEELDHLWLNDNPLGGLPDELLELKKLRFLHLGNVPWASVPELLFEMNWLRELWIASPQLAHLPEALGKLGKLERLHIWHSGLETLPDALFEMTHLRELRVGNNPLPEGTIDKLKEALDDCTIY